MSTWIAWPPEDPRQRFPKNYWLNDPLDQYQDGIETESCPACGFTVQFISDRDQFENWNDHSHESIAGILKVQKKIGDCPSHPKPNWMA
jgi:hypothetical protein